MNNLVIDNYELNVLSNNFEKAQIKILKNTDSRLILNSNKFKELEIILEENSKLYLDSLMFVPADFNIKAVLNKGSHLEYKHISSYQNDITLNVELKGEHASCNVNTLSIAKNFNSNFNTLVSHLAKNTKSDVKNYAISIDDSQIIFNTVGKIEKQMSKSNCVQLTRGINIGKNAQIKALPVLLIDEYDVVAKHGATIGKMSDNELFYLMSRGLSKSDAFKLILSGIINPFLETLIDDNFKENTKKEVYRLI